MSELIAEIKGFQYRLNTAQARSIAIALEFNGSQPNHFNAELAKSEPLRVEGFVGDTRQGGSCNVSQLSINPHCNGTHTECVGHIVDDMISVDSSLPFNLYESTLISIEPEQAHRLKNETYQPQLDGDDLVLSRKSIESALNEHRSDFLKALVIRTTPNHSNKKTMKYSRNEMPAFMTNSAMEFVVSLGVEHLLLDLPSVDRMHDQGLMSNHHLFWQRTRKQAVDPLQCLKTITEMIYVNDELADGSYILNLQIPAFVSDAAPSRPFLIPVEAL